jgi:hypothetical protein
MKNYKELQNQMHTSLEDIAINKKGLFGRLNLGFKFINQKLSKGETIYIRYYDIGKRKLY